MIPPVQVTVMRGLTELKLLDKVWSHADLRPSFGGYVAIYQEYWYLSQQLGFYILLTYPPQHYLCRHG